MLGRASQTRESRDNLHGRSQQTLREPQSVLFNSLTFIVFFVVVVAMYYLPLPWRVRKFNLLIASYCFYAAWNPPFVILLWISTIMDFGLAAAMGRVERLGPRRVLLVVSLITNLGLLGFFKYANFLLESFVWLLARIGVTYQPPALDIVLPVGISFYTFQTLSYTLDVYMRQLKPCPSFLDFALFVTFFPQLVAGPIVRAADFLPQLELPKRATSKQFVFGLFMLVVGLFQKMILANTLTAPIADKVFPAATFMGPGPAWFGVMAFSLQILFDFAGYSTCAIGAALCFGFVINDNFKHPYAAVGFSDFWRRWHVSLSTWLRDYLYIPLGGNRGGAFRTYFNLMLTMLLGGLWHGASWRFVIWGGLHGVYLVIERLLARPFGDRPWAKWVIVQIPLVLLTYVAVLITWVFFRAIDLTFALAQVRTMFTGRSMYLPTGETAAYYQLSAAQYLLIGALTAVMLGLHWFMRNSSLEQLFGRMPWWLRAVVVAVFAVVLALAPGDDRAFIYFQF